MKYWNKPVVSDLDVSCTLSGAKGNTTESAVIIKWNGGTVEAALAKGKTKEDYAPYFQDVVWPS